ncbi:hypothetical protein A4A49_31371 [Nicotiana attenuata]|uniref:DUF4283 domain-containing protein n=1 Tax=Nicotiana attenuata TaxID=49451 RepID=A0A1J6J4V1_NICAT|nr:hypothetical protein A4A49_31371 [Nicotiana attenuata]
MHLPKQQANQSSAGTSTQYTAPNKSSGITHATHTVSQNANANTVMKDSVVQNLVSQSHSPHVSLVDKEVQGGIEKSQEKLIGNQEGVPSGVGIPHVLHECANAQLVDHRLDCVPPATTVPSSKIQHVHQSSDEVKHCEVISFEEELPTQEDDQHQAASNINDKIRVFWDKEFTAKVLDHDEQQLSLEMTHAENGKIFHLTVIYAKCKSVLRRTLWEVIRHKSSRCNVPWCVIGDFNVIALVEEKIGGIPYQMSKIIEFLSMIEDCGLVDLGFYGPKYTWSNGRGTCCIVWKRLDKGLVNDRWLEMFPAATVSHLASTGSDHYPFLLELHIR